ncbi:MAG: alginate export family protein [Bryobacterales bacterium]|nr:alginate export family protein [Bryobacterales bacterium]
MRPEFRGGAGFQPRNNDAYALSRIRFGVDLRPTEWMKMMVEVQDARAPGKGSAAPPFRDPFDLYQAYVELGRENSKVRARVGRQELAYGDERLISPAPWRNVGRSFDGVRVMVGTKDVGVDLIGASEVKVDPASFNLSHGLYLNSLFGAYGRFQNKAGFSRLEPYVLRTTRPHLQSTFEEPKREDRYTFGVGLGRSLAGGIDLSVELARQLGSLPTGRIRASMAAIVLHCRPASAPWSSGISAEYSFVSGGLGTAGHTTATFDSLFLTAHRYFGFADIVGPRNVQDARIGVDLHPGKTALVQLDVHNLWLVSGRDYLYSPSQAIAVAVPPQAGPVPRRIGTEIDATLLLPIGRGQRVGAGVGRLIAGRFLRDFTAGTGGSYAYVLWEVAVSRGFKLNR